jgi:hypothetical protein
VPRQPDAVAAHVYRKTVGLLRTIDDKVPGAARVDPDTLGELADGVGVDRAGFERTFAEFNAAIRARDFDRRSRPASARRASPRRSPTGRCRSAAEGAPGR